MRIHGLGINIGDDYVDGSRQRLIDSLARAQEHDYSVAELGDHRLECCFQWRAHFPARRGNSRSHRALCAALLGARAPGGRIWHLARILSWNTGVLEACIQFAHAIGARVLVYHSGLQALDATRTGTASLPNDDELARGAEQEVAALRKLAPLADDLDVTIGMEKRRPASVGIRGFDTRWQVPLTSWQITTRACELPRW